MGLPYQQSLSFACPLWHTRERLCINQVRSLLSMRCVLQGYSFNPRLYSRVLLGTASLVRLWPQSPKLPKNLGAALIFWREERGLWTAVREKRPLKGEFREVSKSSRILKSCISDPSFEREKIIVWSVSLSLLISHPKDIKQILLMCDSHLTVFQAITNHIFDCYRVDVLERANWCDRTNV